jgi:hypothetical protein
MCFGLNGRTKVQIWIGALRGSLALDMLPRTVAWGGALLSKSDKSPQMFAGSATLPAHTSQDCNH